MARRTYLFDVAHSCSRLCRDRVLPAVLKGVKNLRSSLCKTAIMAVAGADWCRHRACTCFPGGAWWAEGIRPPAIPSCGLPSADLYLIFGDVLLSHTDVGGQAKPATSLLAQLLLKAASNDKRFVVEEAQRALQVR